MREGGKRKVEGGERVKGETVLGGGVRGGRGGRDERSERVKGKMEG